MNCWEYKKCGREAEGDNVEEHGVYPAYPNNGKTCARVAGTLCAGEIQGTFATKLGNCLECDYYKSKHYGALDGDDKKGLNKPTGPARKEERKIAFKRITVHGIDKSYSAVSVNYSKCGLALITNLDLSAGDKLKVSCGSFWERPREGVVVWESQINSNSKKVGLSLCA